ncbi:MAG: TolC family protein, partial [Bacteroidota bacterium]|nr:TolC family protein [Bacteroidota bacterium]
MKNLFIILFLLGTLNSFAQKKWTLKACINHALENNISVRQSQNTLLSNDQDIQAAKGNFLPSLGINGSQRLNLGNVEVFDGQFLDRTFHSTNFGITIFQTIFNGFRNINIYRQSIISKAANEEAYKRIRDDVSLNVVNSYLNV